jgi:hypothetical protein
VIKIKTLLICTTWARVSSVGIANRYGLDGPGKVGGGRFPYSSIPAVGAHPAPNTMGTGSFPGVKRPGLLVNHYTSIPNLCLHGILQGKRYTYIYLNTHNCILSIHSPWAICKELRRDDF